MGMNGRVGAGYGTWEYRQKGGRPVILNELEKLPVSRHTPKYQESTCQNPSNDKSGIQTVSNILNSGRGSQDSCNEKSQSKFNAILYNNSSIFHLPGQAEQTNEKCGKWVHPLSCLNMNQETLTGVLHDRYVVKHSCHRPDCPVCYDSWASRQADAAANRLFQAVQLYRKAGYQIETHRGRSPIGRIDHVVFSPPQAAAIELIKTVDGFRTLRSGAIKILRASGLIGGGLIFHPFRQNDSREPNFNSELPEGVWYVSPHFHIVGCGYLKKSDDVYDLTGWVYKKMERRETVKGTIKYTLTHCGIADGFQALTYFGLFSNNKIVIAEIQKTIEPIKCKACSEPLHLFKLLKNTDNDNVEVDWACDLGVYLHVVIRKTYKLRFRKDVVAS